MSEGRDNLPSASGLVSDCSVRDALGFGHGLGLDRLDSFVLLGHVLGRSRAWLIAHDDSSLTAGELQGWRDVAARRACGEPVAYIVGCKEFRGLRLRVSPAVLVPRPETELLVDLAIDAIDAVLRSRGRVRVVDLGTGSGAIALACKSARPGAEVCASDASAAALEVARTNAVDLGLDIEMRLGSWWEPWKAERFDLALCNPPYVAAGDSHLAALRQEPGLALVGGKTGLVALQEVARKAGGHLVPGGRLWFEHGFDQAGAVTGMLAAGGFAAITTRPDLAGQPRCTGGMFAPQSGA
jgi:release factor glutamine methyltransferase